MASLMTRAGVPLVLSPALPSAAAAEPDVPGSVQLSRQHSGESQVADSAELAADAMHAPPAHPNAPAEGVAGSDATQSQAAVLDAQPSADGCPAQPAEATSREAVHVADTHAGWSPFGGQAWYPADQATLLGAAATGQAGPAASSSSEATLALLQNVWQNVGADGRTAESQPPLSQPPLLALPYSWQRAIADANSVAAAPMLAPLTSPAGHAVDLQLVSVAVMSVLHRCIALLCAVHRRCRPLSCSLCMTSCSTCKRWRLRPPLRLATISHCTAWQRLRCAQCCRAELHLSRRHKVGRVWVAGMACWMLTLCCGLCSAVIGCAAGC